MKHFCTFILIIAVIVGLVGSVYCFSKVQNDTCPYCGAPIEYEGKIIKDGETFYRYTCTEHFWHIVDSPIKIK